MRAKDGVAIQDVILLVLSTTSSNISILDKLHSVDNYMYN